MKIKLVRLSININYSDVKRFVIEICTKTKLKDTDNLFNVHFLTVIV